MTKAVKKKFDAVGMMRTIREDMSNHIEGMTLAEELAWLASQDINDPFLKRLQERTAEHTDLQR